MLSASTTANADRLIRIYTGGGGGHLAPGCDPRAAAATRLMWALFSKTANHADGGERDRCPGNRF